MMPVFSEQVSMQIDWGDGSDPIVIDNSPNPTDQWNRVTVKDTVNNVTVTKMYRDSWVEPGTNRIHSWIVTDAIDSSGNPDPSKLGPQHVYKDEPQPINIKTFFDSPPEGDYQQDSATGQYYTVKTLTPPSAGASGEDAINYTSEFSKSDYGINSPTIQYPSIISEGLPAQRPSDAVMPGKVPTFTVSYLLPENEEKKSKTEVYEARWNFTYKMGDLGSRVEYEEGFTVRPEPFLVPSSLDFRSSPENEPFASHISNIRLFFSQFYNADTDNEIEITVNKNYFLSSSSTFYNASTDSGQAPVTCSDPVHISATGPDGNIKELGPDRPIPIFVVDDKDPVIQNDYSLGAYQLAADNNGVLPCGSKIGVIQFYAYDNNLNIIRYKGKSSEERLKAGLAEMAFKTPKEPNDLPQIDPVTKCIPELEEIDKLSDLQLLTPEGTPKNFTRILGGPDDITKANRTFNASNPVFNEGWNGTDLSSWFVRLVWNRSSQSKWPQSFKGIIYPKILIKNLGPSVSIGKVLPAIRLVDNIKPNVFLLINKPGNKTSYYPRFNEYYSDNIITTEPVISSLQGSAVPESSEGYEKPAELLTQVNPEFEDNNYCWYTHINILEKTRYSFSIVAYDNISQVNNKTDLANDLPADSKFHININSGIKYKWNWEGTADTSWQTITTPPEFVEASEDKLLSWKIPGAKQRRNPTTKASADSLTIMVQDAAGQVEPTYNESLNPGSLTGNIRFLKIFFVTQDTKMTRGTIGQ
jgi:hypothetical protein